MREADSRTRVQVGRRSPADSAIQREMDRLYQTHAAPLEATHWGQLIVIAPDGRFKLGTDEYDLAKAARDDFGKGVYMFRIGPRAVHRIR